MTWIAATLAILLFLESWLHDRRTAKLIAEYARERKSLLDRIQHPQRLQVDTAEDLGQPDQPTDLAELAHVGMEVPDFIQVGTQDG